MTAFPRRELPWGIRSLYPQWAILRRPALPSEVSSSDVLHTPSPAAVPPPGPRQRTVVTVHDLAFLTHPQAFPVQWRAMFRAGLARAVRSADALVTVSRHTAEDLLRRTRAMASRVHVVPLAASLPSEPQDVAATLRRLRVPEPYVLSVGTQEPRKNLVRLIRAYRRLAARGAPHSLLLAGPLGWGQGPLLREASSAGPGSVVFTGALSTEHLDALYRGADVFCYPSLYEGFGLPVLEAMLRGVPCVVSTSSSLPEVAGEAALLVDPLSTAGIAEALERVVSEPGLAHRLREAGRARAARYTWEQTARRTLEVYKSIA